MTNLLIDRGTTWRRLFKFTDREGVVQAVGTAAFEFTIPKHDPVSVDMSVYDADRWELVLLPETTRRLDQYVSATYTIKVNGVVLATGVVNPQGGNNSDGN